MQALSPSDQMFLWLEKHHQPMHVAGLQLYSLPEGAGADYVGQLAASLRKWTTPEPPFNQSTMRKLGRYYWVDDTHFDLEHHFRHSALPGEGKIRDLLAYVSAEHSNLMDRHRPLWEVHLIEGVEGNRFAVYSKFHHALIDGVAGMSLMMRILSTDAALRNPVPLWATRRVEPADKPQPGAEGLFGSLISATSEVARQMGTLPTVVRELIRSVDQARKDPDYASVFRAPECILNKTITGSRRFAAQSYDISRFKTIGKAFGATLNDVVLAVCGGALRDYLLSQNALPDQPLIAQVPVSLRLDSSDSGNQVAAILANLGTHLADPARRLEMITSTVTDSKAKLARMTREEVLNYAALTMAPSILYILTGLTPRFQTFNVTISNVPGPKETLYWNGARLEGMYPVSIPVDRVALNISLVSYVDQLEFGLTACRRTLPGMQRLLDYLEKGICDLEKAAASRS